MPNPNLKKKDQLTDTATGTRQTTTWEKPKGVQVPNNSYTYSAAGNEGKGVSSVPPPKGVNAGSGNKIEEEVMPGQRRPAQTTTQNGPSAAKLAQVEQNANKPKPTQTVYAPGGGGSAEPAAPAAASPAQVVTPSNQLSMPQINGALPQYQFQQGQTPTFDYNGQPVQFDYNGQPVQFNYNGQPVQFQQQQADPALQKQYQDAMATLEKMKGQAPTYGSAYDTQIQDLYQQITGRGPFKYDSKTDPLYQQYVQDYTMQGKMAMRDTMGQAAALTGGYGSSYGQAVGQQAYDQYLQRMADILPETYGMALDAYNAEGDRLAQNLALTQDLEQSDYARYLDRLNQHNIDINRAQTDADTAYNRMIDADERAYGRSIDAYNRDLTAEQLAYSRAADQYNRDLTAEQQAYNRALTQYDIDQAAEAQAYSRAQDAYERGMTENELAHARQQDEYNRLMQENKLAYDRAMDQYDLGREVRSDNQKAQDAYFDKIVGLMSIGYTPTAQDYADAGLTPAQGAALAAAYAPKEETPHRIRQTPPDEEIIDEEEEERTLEDLVTMMKSKTGKERTAFIADVEEDIKNGKLNNIDPAAWRYLKGQS